MHEDRATFSHNLGRFIELCKNDKLIQRILAPLEENVSVDDEAWWSRDYNPHQPLPFPVDPDEELLLRYRILESLADGSRNVYQIGIRASKSSNYIDIVRSAVIRSFVEELGYRLGEISNIASPEDRIVQAVPLSRIPLKTETKVFLSHKSDDKPMVRRYFNALKELGFDPWLDESTMVAGSNLEREIFRGFEESCAAVFFITDNFVDEKYLAAEVDYAIRQKRKKEKKFAIVTLRYSPDTPIPGLLTPYIYRDVTNDLQGFYEVLRALPIELGAVRWKEYVVDS